MLGNAVLFLDTHNSGGTEKRKGIHLEDGHSTCDLGEAPVGFSVTLNRSLFPKPHRMTQWAQGSLLNCYLNMLKMLTVSISLRANNGRKEERLQVYCTCQVFDLIKELGMFSSFWLKRVGSWLSNFPLANQDSCLTPRHSSLLSQSDESKLRGGVRGIGIGLF